LGRKMCQPLTPAMQVSLMDTSKMPQVIESESALGWKGPSEAIQPNSPAVSRDIFTWIGSLRAPSNLAWNASRDGASTTSLGNLCQGFTPFCGPFALGKKDKEQSGKCQTWKQNTPELGNLRLTTVIQPKQQPFLCCSSFLTINICKTLPEALIA